MVVSRRELCKERDPENSLAVLIRLANIKLCRVRVKLHEVSLNIQGLQ
jgi:hypothetical protein